MKEKTGRNWLWRIVDFINPLRDPSLTVAVVLTFIEEVGQRDQWYWIIVVGAINWLAVRGIVWLVVNFTFAFTFISRRVWWAIRHPRLAWRILDAIGHEEIVIGGLPTIGEGMLLPEGIAVMSPALGASGIHVIGELPAGTELPMLNMPNGQMAPHFGAMNGGSGIFPGSSAGMPLPPMGFPQNGFNNQQGNDAFQQGFPQGFPQAFPQRPSEEEERLRQQIAAYSRLMDDWMQFTEEKWRTVSDSQLGWKPLRGRWSGWDDIFQDAYAAKTSDPMARAAQSAGEATARRYESSKDKGSAASAVACFLRDMMTLRRGLEMLQPSSVEHSPETPTIQPVVQPPPARFTPGSGPLRNNTGNTGARNSLIRRPAQIFVDADTQK